MWKRIATITLLAALSGCGSHALVGAWRSRIQFSSGYFTNVKDLEFLYVFNRGGTMTESSNYDGAPPVPPAYGAWRALDTRHFEAVYWFYTTKPPEKPDQLNQGWTPAGHGELTEQFELASNGKSFESTIKLKMFDGAGHPLPGGGQAVGHAIRIDF